MKQLLQIISFSLIFYTSTFFQSKAADVKIYVGDSYTFSHDRSSTWLGPNSYYAYSNFKWVYSNSSDEEYFDLTYDAPAFSSEPTTATVTIKKYFSGSKSIRLEYKRSYVADHHEYETTTQSKTFSFSCKRASLTLYPDVMTLDLGKSQQLQWSISPSTTGASIKKFSSSDATVASVTTHGTVIAQSSGTAVITATTTEGATATCQVIAGTIFATSLSLNNSELELEIGNSQRLVATVLPSYTSDKSLTWKSGNPDIVSVNGNGFLTALSMGTTYITATTNDGTNLTATCYVSVFPPNYQPKRGDLNVDDIVDIDDLNEMIDLMLGKSSHGKKRADLNKDDVIDVSDVNSLIDILIGRIPTSNVASVLPSATTADVVCSLKHTPVEAKCFVVVTNKSTNQKTTFEAERDDDNLARVKATGLQIGSNYAVTSYLIYDDDRYEGKNSMEFTTTTPSASVLSVDEVTLTSAVADCTFEGVDSGVECGIKVQSSKATLSFPVSIETVHQQVNLTGLTPWTEYTCYAYVKAGEYYQEQEQKVSFSTPDLAGTWNCIETTTNGNKSETSTIVFDSNGNATYTHVSGDIIANFGNSTISGQWNINNDGTITISFSDNAFILMRKTKELTGHFNNQICPTQIEGDAKNGVGSTFFNNGTFTMTREQ